MDSPADSLPPLRDEMSVHATAVPTLGVRYACLAEVGEISAVHDGVADASIAGVMQCPVQFSTGEQGAATAQNVCIAFVSADAALSQHAARTYLSDEACADGRFSAVDKISDSVAAAGQPVPVEGRQAALYRWPLMAPTIIATKAIARYQHSLTPDVALRSSDAVSAINADTIELWTAVHDVAALQTALSAMIGLPSAHFVLHADTPMADQAAAMDAALGAVLLLQRVGQAICVDSIARWMAPSKAELTVSAAMTTGGDALAWSYRARIAESSSSTDALPDLAQVLAALPPFPYPTTQFDEAVQDDGRIPYAAHVFARESFIDELAYEHAIDPLALRIDLLGDAQYSGAQKLLGTLAERATWQSPSLVARQNRGDTLQGRGAAFDSHPVGTKAGEAYSAWIVDLKVDQRTGDVDIQRIVAGHATGRPGLESIAGVGAERVAAATSPLLGRPVVATTSFDETPAAQAISHALVTPAAAGLVSAETAAALLVDDVLDPIARAVQSELDMSAAAAAIANALFDATGVRFRTPPFTPERILQGLAADRAGSDEVFIAESAAAVSAPQKAMRDPRRQASRHRRRKRTLWSAVVAGGIGGAIGLASLWPLRAAIAPIDRPLAATWSDATIARGRDIAAAADCAVCHTAAGGAVNAGGLGLDTPFGTVYTTNITPDPETGIGTWSFAAFDRAMRQGISRDGRHLYPAFPYTAFSKFSESDMTALYAYLMAQPAVTARAPETRLPFPLNQRGLLAGWNALFLQQGAYRVDPARSAEWNRGRYLVDGAGHCSACHSPRNLAGAEKGGRFYLSGGSAEGWDAPSLNADSASPVRWSEAALFRYLRTGFSPEHGVAAGPMAPVVAGLATLPEADVRAMAHYLASLSDPSIGQVVSANPSISSAAARAFSGAYSDREGIATSTAMQADVARQADTDATVVHGLDSGKRIFAAACAVCHAETGGVGNFGVRPLLQLNTSVAADTPDNLLQVILHGIDTPATDALGYMPGFKDALDDQQIAELSAYLRARFAPGKSPWANLSQVSAKIRGAHR